MAPSFSFSQEDFDLNVSKAKMVYSDPNRTVLSSPEVLKILRVSFNHHL